MWLTVSGKFLIVWSASQNSRTRQAAAAAAAAVGIQGHRIYIDEDGDAEANYTVVALLPDDEQSDSEMAGKSLQPIGHFLLQQGDIPVRSRGDMKHVAVVSAIVVATNKPLRTGLYVEAGGGQKTQILAIATKFLSFDLTRRG